MTSAPISMVSRRVRGYEESSDCPWQLIGLPGLEVRGMVPKGISKRGEHSIGVHRVNVYDIDIECVSSSRCSPQILPLLWPLRAVRAMALLVLVRGSERA